MHRKQDEQRCMVIISVIQEYQVQSGQNDLAREIYNESNEIFNPHRIKHEKPALPESILNDEN